jgi:hypothetical protein
LEDALIVTSIEINAIAPTMFLKATFLQLSTLGASEGIDTLVHRDIIPMHPADEFDSHSSICCQIFRDKFCVRATVVTSSVTVGGIEGLAEVTQYLCTSTICFVLAILNNRPQHIMESLFLLSTALAFINHLPQHPGIGKLVV